MTEGILEVTAIGNIGATPELRYTSSGTPVSTFPIAINSTYNGKGGAQKRETEWLDVVTWDKQAQSCSQFLSKGQRVYVKGKLKTRTWDTQDGQKRFRIEINADRVFFLDRKESSSNNGIDEFDYENVKGHSAIEATMK